MRGSDKINLGVLLGGYSRGGTEKMNLLTYPRLDRSRFRVSCLFLAPPNPLTREFGAAGLEVVNLGVAEERRFRAGPGIVRSLRRLVREKDLDILHGFGSFCDLAARLAKTGNPGLRLVSGRRSVSHRSGKEGRSLVQAGLERLTRERVDLYISNTEAGRRILVDQEGVASSRVRVIHNGLDLSRRLFLENDREKGRAAEPGPPLILSVGHLERRKDPLCLLRAAAVLRDRGRSFRLWLAGEGPLQGQVEALRAGLALEGIVSLLGRRDDVEDLLARADLFALASNYEGMPVAVMEAMAAGLAVVATEVGGNPELVDQGVTGFLAPRGDWTALAERLEILLLDEGLRRRMGRAGAGRIRDRFDLGEKVGQLERAYLELMEG